MGSTRLLTSALAIGIAASVPAWAQQASAPASGSLRLEFNGVAPSDKGCRLTFVVTNGLSGDLTKASFEIALFNEGGIVDRLSVLDFNDLPANKTKVARFDLPGVDCTKITRVLVNSATACEGAGIDPKACLAALKPESKSAIEFGV